MLGMDAIAYAPAARSRFFDPLRWGSLALLVLMTTALLAGQKIEPVDALWDPQRYIGIEEIEVGMEAYCLTDYGVNGVEEFALEVVAVMRNFEPGRDAILVMGLDERFKHTGVVAGCSGSPVYIDGRLAGALAFGWTFSKDPLYGVTPIREMLQVGTASEAQTSTRTARAPGLTLDLSRPIDLTEINQRFDNSRPLSARATGAMTQLPSPLLISGLSPSGWEKAASQLEAMGFFVAPGMGGSAQGQTDGAFELKPGSALTIPLVAGDIDMNVLGTVTEIRDNRVYGFGHSFLGHGPLNLPMAGGKIYTVISSVQRSSKLGTSTDIIGSIISDETAAIYGKIGAPPKMVPLSIRVEHYNDPIVRIYNCQVADAPSLVPQLVPSAVSAAALHVGELPSDHTVKYEIAINLKGGQAIRFENTSTGARLSEPISELRGSLVLLLNNPFRKAEIESLDVDVQISPENLESHIWSVDVVSTTVKPGDDIEIAVVVESHLSEKKQYRLTLPVPEDVPAGKYQLLLCGAYEYESFLRKNVPHRRLATNYRTLIEALQNVVSVDRTKLYCCLVLPPRGITLEKAELPDLPGTKAVILQNEGRTLRAQPRARWVEKTVETGTVIADRQIVTIVVEEK